MNNKFSLIKAKISQFNTERNDFEENFNKLHDEILIFIKDLPDNLPEKREMISRVEVVLNSFESYNDIVEYFNKELKSIQRLYKTLVSYSDDTQFSIVFPKFKSKIEKLEISFSKGKYLFTVLEEDYNNLILEYNHLILNYNIIVESLIKQQDSEINFQEDNYEINDITSKNNDSFDDEIIVLEEIDESMNNLIIDNDIEELKNNDFLIKFKNYVNCPFYGLMRNSFDFSEDEEINILNEIESDIIQGKINDGNVENIIKERFKNHTQNDYVDNLKEKLNNLINDSKFYNGLSKEYDDLSDMEKQECINELIQSFNLDFKENDIETTLKVLFEDKRKQKHDLNLLDRYKNSIDDYAEEYNLDKNEILEIFDETHNDIIESKLFGMKFEEYIKRKFRDKVDENKIKAVNQLVSLYNKKSILKQVTHLDDEKLLIAFKNIELLISKNRVRSSEINEDFVVKYSMIILSKKIYSEVYDGT